MLSTEVQKISNLYNVALRAKKENEHLDIDLMPFGHARLLYRVSNDDIKLLIVRSKHEPVIVDSPETLELLQYGNLHSKQKVEALQLAYDLLYK